MDEGGGARSGRGDGFARAMAPESPASSSGDEGGAWPPWLLPLMVPFARALEPYEPDAANLSNEELGYRHWCGSWGEGTGDGRLRGSMMLTN